jgi:NosR/NirI family nitrous oxide reductase transcriptional regulator
LTEVKAPLISLYQHAHDISGSAPDRIREYRVKFPAAAIRLFVLCLLLGMASPAHSQTIDELYPQVKDFFPQADRFGEIEGDPPAAAIYRGEQLLGYAYLTMDIIRIPAYSGHPINTLVAFNTDGRIVGIRIVEHQEPILLAGVSE